MRVWLNNRTGVLAACEQFEPEFENGRMVRGKRNGVFVPDSKGPDILHRTVSGQIEMEDTDPRVLAYRGQSQSGISHIPDPSERK